MEKTSDTCEKYTFELLCVKKFHYDVKHGIFSKSNLRTFSVFFLKYDKKKNFLKCQSFGYQTEFIPIYEFSNT